MSLLTTSLIAWQYSRCVQHLAVCNKRQGVHRGLGDSGQLPEGGEGGMRPHWSILASFSVARDHAESAVCALGPGHLSMGACGRFLHLSGH